MAGGIFGRRRHPRHFDGDLVWTLKEPIRGASEGLITPKHPHPFKAASSSFMSVLPGFSLFALYQAGGIRAVAMNVICASGVVALFYGLYVLMPTLLQWIALGIGVYITITWIHFQKLTDPACYGMMFKSRHLWQRPSGSLRYPLSLTVLAFGRPPLCSVFAVNHRGCWSVSWFGFSDWWFYRHRFGRCDCRSLPRKTVNARLMSG